MKLETIVNRALARARLDEIDRVRFWITYWRDAQRKCKRAKNPDGVLANRHRIDSLRLLLRHVRGAARRPS